MIDEERRRCVNKMFLLGQIERGVVSEIRVSWHEVEAIGELAATILEMVYSSSIFCHYIHHTKASSHSA
jgi:hypothetical protein